MCPFKFDILNTCHVSLVCVQATSQKRKPRSKKSKTIKQSKAEEMIKSPSSEPTSEKRSDDDDEEEEEDEIEEEKVHADA